jgi:hypothetical protein
MRKLLGGVTASFGLAVATLGAWILVRGPFLDGATLEATPMLAALTAFIVGIVVFFRGLVRFAGVGARL